MNTQAFSSPAQPELFSFQNPGSRSVIAGFSGGHLSSDGAMLLLRQPGSLIGLTRELAACFAGERNEVFVEHSLRELPAQRVLGLAAG